MSLFYSISPTRGTMSYLIVTSPSAPLDDNSLSDFLCFGWPWQFWGILVRHFIECPSIWVYLIFLMMILEKGRPQKWNVILTTSHLDMMSALLMWWLALITWPRWYLGGFFCVACMCANLLQLCPTLCYTTDCSPPGSSVHGILTQEYWSGLPRPPPGDLPEPGITSRGPPWPRGHTCISHVSCNGRQVLYH